MTGVCSVCERDVPVNDLDRALPHPSAQGTNGLCGGTELKVK